MNGLRYLSTPYAENMDRLATSNNMYCTYVVGPQRDQCGCICSSFGETMALKPTAYGQERREQERKKKNERDRRRRESVSVVSEKQILVEAESR